MSTDPKTCVWCGNTLTGNQQKFCSASCKTLEHRARSPKYAEAQRASRRAWGKRNKEKVALATKKWRKLNPITPEKQTEYSARYYEKNKHKIREQARVKIAERRKTDPSFAERERKANRRYYNRRVREDYVFRMIKNLRRRMNLAIKAAGAGKSCGTQELIGCSHQRLKAHLESQFKPGMTWKNYGKWHVDHIRPCASFNDLTEMSQQKDCFHYSNLQPLWASENMSKNARWEAA